nr:EF-hand domain-containing family member B-like [Leptinotarsa decemlineata]
MAGNEGKFKDRSPIICAAGMPSGTSKDNVENTLKEYSLEDEVTAVKHDANIWFENEFRPPLQLPPIQNACFKGTMTEIKPLLNPPMRARYETLLDELKETTYSSYWQKPVGKGRDQVPGLPKGMIPTEVTFGKPFTREIPLRELVNPPKTPYEVLQESQVGHELYKKTHNDYNPSEQVERGYKSPPFQKEKCFGISSKYDYRGIWVRCACDWHIKEPVMHASKIQADYLDRVRPQIGKILAPNHNIECVPKGHTFGDRSERSFFGLEDLLKDSRCEPCVFKRDFYKWISSLNKFKLRMKQRRIDGFDFNDFYKKALYWDQEKTGYLPTTIFYELCSCHQIMFPKEDIESLLKVLGIMQEEKINYKRFIDLINVNEKPIEFMPMRDIPKESLYYVTTNQAASCDYLIIDNSGMSAAGMPSIRTDLVRPVVPPTGCRADLDNLGDESTVNSLINPSIYTNYGLTSRDFFTPRTAETIRTLFEKIGYNFPNDSFEKIWKEGVEHDQTGLVCVETFKSLLTKYIAPPKITVDERDCEKKM